MIKVPVIVPLIQDSQVTRAVTDSMPMVVVSLLVGQLSLATNNFLISVQDNYVVLVCSFFLHSLSIIYTCIYKLFFLSWYTASTEATDNITHPGTAEPTDTGKWNVVHEILLYN